MISTNYNLCSHTYKSNLSKGFATLQQQQEFVDITLAAEGHLVKAHQNILALASPYIKAMLHSAPCQHPVIFLSNVGHNVLAYILQYVYSGEVQVPSDIFSSFVEAAKHMHIVGLEHLSVPKDFITLHEIKDAQNESEQAELLESIDQEPNEVGPENFVAKITINNTADNDLVENVLTHSSDIYTDTLPSPYENGLENSQNTTDMVDFEDLISQETKEIIILKEPSHDDPTEPVQQNNTNIDINGTQEVEMLTAESDDNTNINNLDYNVTDAQEPTQAITVQDHIGKVAYTKSIRGTVQLMLNRYLYNMHYQAEGGRKRRWRCLDYRRKHCQAFVDTRDGIPIKRKHEHTHAFHDAKIIKSAKKGFFSSICQDNNKIEIKIQHNDSDDENTN